MILSLKSVQPAHLLARALIAIAAVFSLNFLCKISYAASFADLVVSDKCNFFSLTLPDTSELVGQTTTKLWQFSPKSRMCRTKILVCTATRGPRLPSVGAGKVRHYTVEIGVKPVFPFFSSEIYRF